jgi:hypothetical protein
MDARGALEKADQPTLRLQEAHFLYLPVGAVG